MLLYKYRILVTLLVLIKAAMLDITRGRVRRLLSVKIVVYDWLSIEINHKIYTLVNATCFHGFGGVAIENRHTMKFYSFTIKMDTAHFSNSLSFAI